MENDLHQAFYGVFCSSKEIIKNKQRHLYVNMLDLLGRTCRATGLAENKIGADNLVKFWLEDILPLIFDSDKTIQSCAISTLEQGISLMETSTIHSCKSWPLLRNDMVSKLPDKIHELRSNKNKHWHQVWCLIIKILDRDILNGATIINAFLSTVELGFRSPEATVRAETFLCWRLLIKIFHSYNELLTPKRLKLICIPLKSTQSKSANLANVKIRVWWYFITCIGDKIGEHFAKVVEPFLAYLFGTSTRESVSDVQQFENIQMISVLCLAQILSEEKDDFIDILLMENSLETLGLPSAVLNLNILKEHWKTLTYAVVGAVKLFSTNGGEGDEISDSHEAKRHMQNWLIIRLVKIMLRLNFAPCTQEICKALIDLSAKETLPLCTALNCIASNNIIVDVSQLNGENLCDILTSITSLLIAGKSFISAGVLLRCIEQIGKIPQLFDREETRQQAMYAIIKVVCSSKDDDDFEAFETRLLCWKRVAQTIIAQLPDKNLSYRRKDVADVINGFILWPLQQLSLFAGDCQTAFFNDDFCAAWRQLLLCGQNSPNRELFLKEVEKTLRALMNSTQKELPLAELVNAYVAAVLKLDSGKDSPNLHIILSFLHDLIDRPKITATKSFEIYLNTLRNAFLHFSNDELRDKFEMVKMSIAHVLNVVARDKPSNMKVVNDWKVKIMERFRLLPQRNYASQIREVFKNDDVFVIIPNVWMLNPEKLTERQKERFAERSDIPALYNDMSQSQDSSIKPWTPNKIVLAKKDQTEIVIGPSQQNVEGETNNTSSADVRTTRRRGIKSVDVFTDNSSKSKDNSNNVVETEEMREGCKNNSELIPTDSTTAIRTRKSLRNRSEEVEQKETDAPEGGNVTKSPKKSSEMSENISVQKKSPDSSEGVQEKVCSSPTTTRRRLCSLETESSSETQTFPLVKNTLSEEVIPETPASTVDQDARETEALIHAAAADTLGMNLEPKEVSPKKPTTKIVGLSSPPDRKSTNNSCSPSLRPKPTPHLTRGAQFISMIRSKMKMDNPAVASARSSIHLNKSERRESTPIPDVFMESSNVEITSTPLQKKDLLTFTKRLPSPSASPSASILKRKLRRDSLDEISTESPATKRKRVSFHDPPVSLTKEYVRDVEENLIKPKRCLTLDKANTGNSAENKNTLKRRTKLDSMIEIESFQNEPPEKLDTSADRSNNSSTSSARNILLHFEEDNNTESPADVCQQPNPPEQEIHVPNLPDAETALNIVLEECSLETVLERYLNSENTSAVKTADTLAKFISKCMTTNAKVKASVLEMLSENHSKDFLDHAVQENLSSVVCDRLNLDSVTDYICAKSKLNTSCRNNLLSKIPEVLKHSKVEKEPLNFIGTLVESLKPTDATILDLIDSLMRIRHERQSSSTPEMDSTDVSSSNL